MQIRVLVVVVVALVRNFFYLWWFNLYQREKGKINKTLLIPILLFDFSSYFPSFLMGIGFLPATTAAVEANERREREKATSVVQSSMVKFYFSIFILPHSLVVKLFLFFHSLFFFAQHTIELNIKWSWGLKRNFY
jgi:hypothetical protein